MVFQTTSPTSPRLAGEPAYTVAVPVACPHPIHSHSRWKRQRTSHHMLCLLPRVRSKDPFERGWQVQRIGCFGDPSGPKRHHEGGVVSERGTETQSLRNGGRKGQGGGWHECFLQTWGLAVEPPNCTKTLLYQVQGLREPLWEDGELGTVLRLIVNLIRHQLTPGNTIS